MRSDLLDELRMLDCYGYNIAVIDLRNLTYSHGNDMQHLIKYHMNTYRYHRNIYRATPGNIIAKAGAEKYYMLIGIQGFIG